MKYSKIVSFLVIFILLITAFPVQTAHATSDTTTNSQVVTWTPCAVEGGFCTFTGTKLVRYGSGTTYVTGTYTDGVACTNGVFGDPTPGVVKTCDYSDPPAPALNSFTRQNPATSPTNADILIFRVTFSEEVQNIDSTDFVVNSTSTATVTNLSEVGGTWIYCADENGFCAFTGTRFVRYGAPGFYSANTGPFTNGVACTNAVFGDPIVGTVKTCEIFATDTYDITVSGGDLASYNGTVGLDLAAGQNIQNLIGTALPAGEPTPDETYVLDNAGPTVTVEQASGQSDPTNNGTIKFTVTFIEPINTVTFTATDVVLSASTAPGTLVATVTQVAPNDDTTFNIAVSGMTGSGNVIASLNANTVQDTLGNNNAASTSTDNTVTYDVNALTVTVEQAASQVDPTNVDPINFTATFNKPINTATFVPTDVVLSASTAPGTLAATLTEVAPNDGTTFNIAVSGMTGSGTVVASINANTVQDPANNDNSASTSTDNTVTYDTANPIVASTDLTASYTRTGPASFTVVFNKDVADPAGNTGADDVTNPANFLLVNKGSNGTADTVSCSGGVVTDDTKVTVSSVSYDNATFEATITLASSLPVGSYRLFICGTTSIVDSAGNPLNGGNDYTFDFTVNPAPERLPDTGFAQGLVTILPEQPAAKAYTNTDLVLEFPSLDQKMTIVGVPQSETSWDVTWLGNNAGWLNGSAYPTWAGNTVLTGHVWDAYNQPGPFANLKSLKYGDQFHVHAFGQTYTYEVRESTMVTSKKVSAVMKHEELDWVTLVTCEFYNPFNNTYYFRRVVRAVLISVN